MDNNSQKDELRVERYDAAAAERKKKAILLKTGVSVGLALAILGYFGLTAWRDRVAQERIDDRHMIIVGGAGAWFESEVIFPEDDETIEDEGEAAYSEDLDG